VICRPGGLKRTPCSLTSMFRVCQSASYFCFAISSVSHINFYEGYHAIKDNMKEGKQFKSDGNDACLDWFEPDLEAVLFSS